MRYFLMVVMAMVVVSCDSDTAATHDTAESVFPVPSKWDAVVKELQWEWYFGENAIYEVTRNGMRGAVWGEWELVGDTLKIEDDGCYPNPGPASYLMLLSADRKSFKLVTLHEVCTPRKEVLAGADWKLGEMDVQGKTGRGRYE